ncbi:MAG: hypothetical protein HPPSJP_2250 [Candidatus Hepatoplasma scabrum]|nr:MAG: hypothetical protein HPPSJP_2250 [Candidatus Hepatoplasma sp.]
MEKKINFNNRKNDYINNLNQLKTKVSVSLTDSAHVQTINPVSEGGGFQQEVNENIIKNLDSIIDGNISITTNTSSVNTIDYSLEGGTTQEEVNKTNKQNLNNLSDQIDDLVEGNNPVKTITSFINTIDYSLEGGKTQEEINKINKEKIDSINNLIDAIDDKISDSNLEINTNKINATNITLEGGTTQQEINIRNKSNFETINSEITDLNDKIDDLDFLDGDINTSSVKAIDTLLEGGVSQKEINEINKQNIDNINITISDLDCKIDDIELKTDTSFVDTVDGFFEGGTTQQEVNESNKVSILKLDSKIISINSEITDLTEKIECLECCCNQEIDTSLVSTTNCDLEDGNTQQEVNQNNKKSIDNLNNQIDTIDDSIIDINSIINLNNLDDPIPQTGVADAINYIWEKGQINLNNYYTKEEVDLLLNQKEKDYNDKLKNLQIQIDHLFICTKCRSLNPIAMIQNIVPINVTANGGEDGLISFAVTISNFKGLPTARLNPAVNNTNITLSDGENADLVFDLLPAGNYSIEIYDDETLINSENGITISEPAPLPEAVFENVIATDVTENGLSDGLISFDVTISNFVGTPTARLNPAGDTQNITLNDGTNIDLFFYSLQAGNYSIEIYDDETFINSETGITINEPAPTAKVSFESITPTDVTINDLSDDSISFTVNISNFVDTAIARLNRSSDTENIILSDGEKIDLSFDSLPAGTYNIEIYDDDILINKEEIIIDKVEPPLIS